MDRNPPSNIDTHSEEIDPEKKKANLVDQLKYYNETGNVPAQERAGLVSNPSASKNRNENNS